MRKLKLDELNRYDVTSFKTVTKLPVIAVLDNIRSAHNVGTFFRTADAFAFESIYLCGVSARPPHTEITKTAIGATESVPWLYFKTTLEACQQLKIAGYTIIGVEQTDKSIALEKIQAYKAPKTALIFGNEVEGLTDDILTMIDIAIEIPQYGTKHSLNVAVCGGIVMHHFAEQLRKIS